MTLRELISLLRRHWLLLLIIPVVTAASVYFFARNQDKKYTSDTVVYTGIASGYKIEGDNNTGGGGWSATGTAFDNLLTLINSRDTKQEVCLRLIAEHLVQNNEPRFLEEAPAGPAQPGLLGTVKTKLHLNSRRMRPLLSDTLRNELKAPGLDQTTENVLAFYKSHSGTGLHKLINSKHPLFSERALDNLAANRIKDSDLLKVEYTAKDPQVCRETLEILTQVFIRKHRELFADQNESVIGYFDKAAQKAHDRLQTAEQKLQDFHQKHNIVDYDKEIIASTDEKQLAQDKYNNLAMQYAGAVSTLKSVEGSLTKRGVSHQKSQEIMRLRNRLSDLSGQISELEVLNQTQRSAENAGRLAALKQESEAVSKQIGETVNNYYADSHSVQGVALKDMLQDYTKNTLLVADLKSQLGLMRQQKETFTGQYNRLVPLGAEMRRLRREVEVAEKEYMSQMEGLKQSRLSQQNVELASKLKVVDPPNLPDTAVGSKLLLLLIGGFFGAFFLTSGGLVAADMLNTSLQKPSVAAKATQLPVLGILPKTDNLSQQQLLDARRAEDQLARQLLLKFHQKAGSDQPYIIGVLSSQTGEGKTALCSSLTASLNNMKIKTLSLFPNDHAFQVWTGDDRAFYSPLQGLTPGITVADLAGARSQSNAVIIVEFPALLEATYPASLLQSLDLVLVTVNAARTWQQADRMIFRNIKTVTKAPIEIVLNGVLPEYVTDFIGARVKVSNSRKKAALPPHPEPALIDQL